MKPTRQAVKEYYGAEGVIATDTALSSIALCLPNCSIAFNTESKVFTLLHSSQVPATLLQLLFNTVTYNYWKPHVSLDQPTGKDRTFKLILTHTL